MFEFAKIYIRSLIAICTVTVMMCYGMYLEQITQDIMLTALGVIGVCVLFDKPKIEEI
jgi:hypothetical protein